MHPTSFPHARSSLSPSLSILRHVVASASKRLQALPQFHEIMHQPMSERASCADLFARPTVLGRSIRAFCATRARARATFAVVRPGTWRCKAEVANGVGKPRKSGVSSIIYRRIGSDLVDSVWNSRMEKFEGAALTHLASSISFIFRYRPVINVTRPMHLH